MKPIRRRRMLLSGPVLIGFGTIFDEACGDPMTPRPYPRVTPSVIAGTLLPFPCPHCGCVRKQVIDAKTRLGYYDAERDFSWCPACRKRYVIDSKGTPLVDDLPAGATHAPALVGRGEKSEVIGRIVEDDGLDVLGAM